MPVMELRAAILKVSVNPTIEVWRTPAKCRWPPWPRRAAATTTDEELDFNPDIDAILQRDDEWRDYFMQGMENTPSYEEEEKRQYLLDSIRQQGSLQDHLLEQLSFTDLKGEDHDLAVLLIDGISDDGTSREPAGHYHGFGPQRARGARRPQGHQTFDPPGVEPRCAVLLLSSRWSRTPLGGLGTAGHRQVS